MIVVRVASFVSVAPFYGTNNTPRRVKIGFSVMVAILLFQILERPALDYEGVFGFAVIIIRGGNYRIAHRIWQVFVIPLFY